MKYSLILFIASLMLMARFALGQVPYFETRNMDEDIPGVIARKVIQTGNGNLLVGTNQGLVTYDGHEFKLLTWGDSSRAEISSLFQSNSGEIWAGGHNGVIYHVKHDSIIEFFFEEGHPGVAVTAFAESSDSLMWFGTYGEGIYYWDGRRQFNINMDDGLPDNYVYDIITDRKGNCWAGTDRGLVRCRLVDGKKEVKGFGLENGLSDLIIISLAEGEDGKIWYGTYEHGIGNIDPLSLEISTPTIMSGWNYGAAETLLSYGDQLLIGTGRNGIIRYDIKNKSLQGWTQTQRELTFNRISDLLLDDQMNIWAASYGQLVRSPGHALEFTVTKPGSAESPGAILQDKNGNIFIAYGNELWFHKYEKGVFGKAARVNLNRKVNSIISLYEDERKRIWIGSFGEGIIIYDPKNEQERYIDESQGLRNGNILSIDGYGQHVWLATLGGAEHILLNEDEGNNTFSYSVKHLGEEEGLANNFIYKVFADSRDRVWFGTDGNGISVIEKGVVSNIFPDTEMADLVVYSITEDQKGNIWFSTARNGIYCLGDTVWHLEPGQGLKGSDIRGLAADNSGRLLILHNEGITIYDILKGHYTTTSNVFTSKSSSINLNALSVREGIANIGTGEGFISINTSFLPENITPPTIINRVSVFLSPQSLEGGISLKHNKNYLSFHYSGLWFAEPEKVSYEVMLGGHDMEWVPTTDRSVTYANLPPGDYVFRVRSSIDGIFDKTSESSYSLSIRKPFWTTYWFLS
ncbi:MAG TPA: two-component regulator propeller domain-containing protein, partial [Bacteroidales bacterium]|nr:two-component regulator propeller domain-containing protein [Bacteroidales bacterium]